MKSKGFTLIDMVVAVAVGGVVILIFMNVISFMKMTDRKFRLKADARITRTIGERFLWMAMKNSAPSFNTLKVPDDNTNNFYDLNRDLPTVTTTPASRQRKVTIDTTPTTAKTFEVLMTNTNVADANKGYPTLIYLDPAKLYPITPGAPFSLPLDYNLFKNAITSANPNMLVSPMGPVFLEVFIPSNFRMPSQPMTAPPNPSSFFLKYQGGTFTAEDFGGRYVAAHPLNTSTLITSLDQFIKQMPSAAGGIPPLMVRAVKLIRYEIQKHPTLKKTNGSDQWELYYTTWNGVVFATPVKIADNVLGLTFARSDVADPAITIDLLKEEPTLCEKDPVHPGRCL